MFQDSQISQLEARLCTFEQASMSLNVAGRMSGSRNPGAATYHSTPEHQHHQSAMDSTNYTVESQSVEISTVTVDLDLSEQGDEHMHRQQQASVELTDRQVTMGKLYE